MNPAELRIITALRSMQAFHNLDPLHLHKLASVAAEKKFKEGEIIYRAGDVGQAIYLIQEGEVAIEMELVDYGPVRLFTVEPGQLFGWSSLFPTRRKQARARVLQPTHVIAIKASRLQDLFRQDHELERAVMDCMTEVVVDRVRGARLELAKAMAAEQKKDND
ncbi:MAG: cyclic nucleotide-binding domain-containing protein [Chloroflexota bacterium]